MAPVFLFGTLRHSALLQAVAGDTLATRPARLLGYRTAKVAGEVYPVLAVQVGAMADGLLISPDAPSLARLDFYEACFGYTRQPVTVLQDGDEIAAEVWVPDRPIEPDQGDWLLDDWARDWGAIQVTAAAEVMRQLGHQTPRDVGARFGIIQARAHAYVRASTWSRPHMAGSMLRRSDVLEVDTTPIHDGFFVTQDLHVTHRRFDGGVNGPVDRGVFRVADAATVMPYDPHRDRILLVEQLRIGPLAAGDPAPWLLEPIAGLIDAGETPEQTAHREAMEEAHLHLNDLIPIGRYYPTPGGVAQVLFSYLGLADLPDSAARLGGEAGESEDIKGHLIPYDLACNMLETGDMANASTMISMQYLMFHRDRLRAEAGAG